MFSKVFASAAVLLAISSQVNAHAAIAPALGVSGNPARSDVQRPSAAKPCGKIDPASTIDSSTPIQAAADGTFTATVTDFNAGKDGSRSVSGTVDATGTGNTFAGQVTVSTNGDPAPKTVGSDQITASLPAGTTCSGGAAGNLCLVSFKTTAGFGNCVVVSQGAAAGAATGAAQNATGAASATGATGAAASAAGATNGTAATGATGSTTGTTTTGKKNKKGKGAAGANAAAGAASQNAAGAAGTAATTDGTAATGATGATGVTTGATTTGRKQKGAKAGAAGANAGAAGANAGAAGANAGATGANAGAAAGQAAAAGTNAAKAKVNKAAGTRAARALLAARDVPCDEEAPVAKRGIFQWIWA